MSNLLEILGRGLLVELRAAFRDVLGGREEVDLACSRHLAESAPDDADALSTYALVLMDHHELQRARTTFEDAIAVDPSLERARIGLACALDALGFTEDAIEQLHISADNSADSSDGAATVFAIAYCQERLGDTDGALIAYAQALELVPGLRNARERMAAIHFRAGDLTNATECYEEICAIDPGDLDSMMTLANLHLQCGNFDAAARHYENTITLDPDNWTTTDQFVEMCVESGRIDDAIRELQRRIDQREDAADQHLRLGDLYHKAGRPRDAERAYERAIEINPEYLEATIKSGTARLRRGDFASAATAFANAIEINDRITTAYVGLGVAHSAVGGKTQAEECFEMAGGISGNSTLLFSEIARMELQATAGSQSKKHLDPANIATHPQGPVDESVATLIDGQIETLRKMLQETPGHADRHYRLGVLLESKGDLEAALDAYDEAVTINPQYLKAQTRRSLALHRLGRFQEATVVAKCALDIDPESVELHYQLGLLFADQRRFSAAMDEFDFAAAYQPSSADYTAHLAIALQHMGLLDRATETINLLSDLEAAKSPIQKAKSAPFDA